MSYKQSKLSLFATHDAPTNLYVTRDEPNPHAEWLRGLIETYGPMAWHIKLSFQSDIRRIHFSVNDAFEIEYGGYRFNSFVNLLWHLVRERDIVADGLCGVDVYHGRQYVACLALYSGVLSNILCAVIKLIPDPIGIMQWNVALTNAKLQVEARIASIRDGTAPELVEYNDADDVRAKHQRRLLKEVTRELEKFNAELAQ